mgnify:CR=1 FL=1
MNFARTYFLRPAEIHNALSMINMRIISVIYGWYLLISWLWCQSTLKLRGNNLGWTIDEHHYITSHEMSVFCIINNYFLFFLFFFPLIKHLLEEAHPLNLIIYWYLSKHLQPCSLKCLFKVLKKLPSLFCQTSLASVHSNHTLYFS